MARRWTVRSSCRIDGSRRVSTYHATIAAKPELMSHWYSCICPTPLHLAFNEKTPQGVALRRRIARVTPADMLGGVEAGVTWPHAGLGLVCAQDNRQRGAVVLLSYQLVPTNIMCGAFRFKGAEYPKWVGRFRDAHFARMRRWPRKSRV